MTTVSYKHQPGIDATNGHITKAILDGKQHVYTVSKVLWPEDVSELISSLLIPKSLHVCCGKSMLGDIRVDLHDESADVKADAVALPFGDESFETVLCDPPYNGKFQWNHDLLTELSRVASKRIIFQHWFIPCNPEGRYKKWKERWELSQCFIWQPRTYFGRVQVISVMDRIDLQK